MYTHITVELAFFLFVDQKLQSASPGRQHFRFNQRYGNLSTLGTLLTFLCRPYPDHVRTYSDASVK